MAIRNFSLALWVPRFAPNSLSRRSTQPQSPGLCTMQAVRSCQGECGDSQSGYGDLTHGHNQRDGRYSAPALGLGNYQVTAQLQGFQSQVRSGIALTVGREVVVDSRSLWER